ncbi:MAG TPA: S9 family peptidase [Thermoanaerobaculia bacterium]
MNRRIGLFVGLCLFALPLAAAEPRLLRTEDAWALKTVLDPQVSPDGQWVSYAVRSLDPKEDTRDTDLYMVPLAGGEPLRLTTSPKGESRGRWSPDGRYLAFLSGRDGDKSQVWLLDRRGGEAVKLTDYKSGVSDLAWAPDSSRLALIVSDVDPDEPDPEAEGAEKTPKPIVIRRLQFKRDGEGYLREIRSHIHVVDVKAKRTLKVTSGPYDHSGITWSPDGRWIAFVSNRTAEPDANYDTDVFLVEPKANQTPRRLTPSSISDESPVFSPDGKWVAYVSGGAPEDIWYATSHVAVVPVGGGEPRPLTRELDRNVGQLSFSPDGRWIYFLLEDGGNQHLARVPAAGGPVERVVAGERVVESYALGPKGEPVVLETQVSYPAELSVLDGQSLRRLTHVNDEFLKGIRLAQTQRFKAKNPDGQLIDGFLTLPPDAPAGKRLPTILRIHGGPVAQYTTGFQLEWQIFAAHGYAVVAANPRGSSGYGREFSRAIWADWGNKDYDDVMAAVDHVIAMGVADPERLGVGGWSYGGMLTDYVITKTGRFKAATTGASETNYLANYGTDHYQREWEAELGLPWKNTELWMRISPFFQVDKVTTPTLVLCGAQDVNVPCLNSEQLFQALRRLGRETELVIYPDQSHSIQKPTYVKDRFDRYLAWYDKYLKGQQGSAPSAKP